MSIAQEVEDLALVYPHQLFPTNPAVQQADHVLLVEEPLFFTQFSFHKKKMVLHRASMKWYQDQLNTSSDYIEYHEIGTTSGVLELTSTSVQRIHITRLTDHWLTERLTRQASEYDVELQWYDSPLFYLNKSDLAPYLNQDKYLLESFYRDQRRNSGILMNDDGSPMGNQWNYDKQNRKSLPEDKNIPPRRSIPENEYVREARSYVNTHFDDHYGSAEDFSFPVTRPDALEWLEEFFRNRFADFGPYQDAISSRSHTLFHSLLSPMINIGLITPEEVLHKAEKCTARDIPLNSIEGFVRQILGWREFMRLMYHSEGVTMRNRNYFGHSRRLPEVFWTGKTGMPPIDDTIDFVLQTGYAHHIERLMILANFMVLCEIAPSDVYRWFMTLFIDAYDWVMVPNVYDMGLYASGGIFATKPYISSSNYIRKMSNYSRGEWCDIWDGLYWRFIHKNQEKLRKNHRMGLIMAQLDKMNSGTLESHLEKAEQYLDELFTT